MTAAALILFTLLRLVDPSSAEVQRVETFAAEVTRAVDAAPALPFTGSAAREATIAALLVIAHHESGLRPEVIDCRERGDHGRSVSAFQLLGPFGRGGLSVDAVCSSNELAAGAALRVLELHAIRCTRSAPLGWFRAYASGSCGTKSDAAEEMCAAWSRAATRLGIVGASCDVAKPLSWRIAE